MGISCPTIIISSFDWMTKLVCGKYYTYELKLYA